MAPLPALNVDRDQIVIPGKAKLYVAPVGSVMPDHLTDDVDPAFVSLGYTDDSGVKFSDMKTIAAFTPQQSFYAVRRWVTDRSCDLTAVLAEWDAKTIPLAFGGGVITEPSPGEFRYTPPDPEDLDERAMIVQVEDGEFTWQIGIPVGMVTSNTETTFAKGPALLPITFSVNGDDEGAPWFLDSDHPAMEDAAS